MDFMIRGQRAATNQRGECSRSLVDELIGLSSGATREAAELGFHRFGLRRERRSAACPHEHGVDVETANPRRATLQKRMTLHFAVRPRDGRRRKSPPRVAEELSRETHTLAITALVSQPLR